jgi:hypothetical protein
MMVAEVELITALGLDYDLVLKKDGFKLNLFVGKDKDSLFYVVEVLYPTASGVGLCVYLDPYSPAMESWFRKALEDKSFTIVFIATPFVSILSRQAILDSHTIAWLERNHVKVQELQGVKTMPYSERDPIFRHLVPRPNTISFSYVDSSAFDPFVQSGVYADDK